MHHRLRTKLSFNNRVASVFLSLILASCGGGDTESNTTTKPIASAVTVTVSGKVVAPDGVTPIANALVYIENSAVALGVATTQKTNIVSAGTTMPLACGAAPNPDWAATCSGSDGAFTLPAKAAAGAKLVISKGVFKSETLLGNTSAGTVALGSVAFATNTTPGTANTLPKIAVVTGYYDSIEDILAKLGFGELDATGQLKLGTEKFKLYSGDGSLNTSTYATSDKLFMDADGNGKADIFDYAIVFWNCGTDEAVPLTAANKAILRQYVQGGGRLYASDLAYDIVEQVFPEFIDFYGSDTTPAASAELQDVAQVGIPDITVNATVDSALKAWLQTVTCFGGPCVQADGSVKISGFLDGWAVMNGSHPNAAGVKTWANGPVSFSGSVVAVNKPLTVSFSVGSGRITYTSYHNEAAVSGELEPQQRILQYLVFEL